MIAATREWIDADGFLAHAGMSALGLRHGFTTKRLGNMKDDAQRAAAAARLGLPAPLLLKQVHGTTIHRASPAAQGLEGDGWTLGPGDEGLCVAVYTADCVPLFLWSDDGRYAGVFHAGWRGMAAGMPEKAVAALVARGVKAERLHAAFGPHIGADAYKVGDELRKSFPETAFRRKGTDFYLDLAADARRRLTTAGVPTASIGAEGPCTLSHPDDFHSFRRAKDGARMLALLSLDRRPA